MQIVAYFQKNLKDEGNPFGKTIWLPSTRAKNGPTPQRGGSWQSCSGLEEDSTRTRESPTLCQPSSKGTEAEPRARLRKNVSLKVQGKYDSLNEVNHLRNLPLISGRITCCTRTNIKSGYPEPRPSCWPRNRAVSYPTSRW